MILSCSNISKTFDDNTVLSNCSFHVEDHEKTAIVGVNGAGKSTLLKIIMKELSADTGEVVISKDKTIGYLAQYQDIDTDNTIYDELLTVKQFLIDIENRIRSIEHEMKNVSGDELESLMNTYTRLTHQFEDNGGYAYKSEIVGVLKGLGFTDEDFSMKISTLSGGQKTRVSLGKLLLSKPDIILLDEPTNHLDITSISWLEGFLSNYPGCVIIVAHDRYFLDKIVTKVVEIDRGCVTTFSGNYSDYATKKAMLRENAMKAYINQQREIKHQEEVIAKLRSFNREKSIKRAESREKMLDKIDVIDKPIMTDNSMKFTLEPKVLSGNDVLTVTDISKSFGDLNLFKNVSFEIKRGERVAIIGSNGTGKTTILKIINEIISADSGEIKTGSKVNIGYYDQEHHVLDMEKTIFDEISDAYPTMTGTEIRNVLAAFLFTGDDVFKLIGDLSGGEKGRVSLAKLMLSNANFLILDEPTNHLDMDSKEILENALLNYTGTVLYVSHDRYFINKTATRILDLECGMLVNYTGNYDYYMEKHDILSPALNPEKYGLVSTNSPSDSSVKSNSDSINATSTASSKQDWQAMKEEQAKERKRQNDLKKTEDEISKTEAEIAALDEELAKEDVYSSSVKCMEVHKEQQALKDKLDALYEKWDELMS
ncbi:MAG: ABC-F family ATP-binding cassette domain-containing protein [Lachnospiraceae bacterium]|nr:ABC-F family ATP-binding cassette domain-containing protein [Lachnospiraceae bacterium]